MIVVLSVIAVAWLVTAALTTIAMARRGFDPWSWGFIALIYGFFAPPMAVVWSRRHARGFESVVDAGEPRSGGVDALAGIDGSAASHAAVEALVRLLGRRMHSLTLATVVDYDAAQASRRRGGRIFTREAEQLLAEAAALVPSAHPRTVILAGNPADALQDYAARHGIEVIAVGPRGRGITKSVLGSVAQALVQQPDLLVLVAGTSASASTTRAVAHHPTG
jgi:nucleotide-binding universal stress UspA family protein